MFFQGHPVDRSGRCIHWSGALDIVAFRFACCDGWWPCLECHNQGERHLAAPWPKSRAQEASVLCGACRHEMTAAQYVASDCLCPSCGSSFNPHCKPHWYLYFEP